MNKTILLKTTNPQFSSPYGEISLLGYYIYASRGKYYQEA